MHINRMLTKLCRLKLGGPVFMPHRVEWLGYHMLKKVW